jgi:hypothetical protein
MATITITLVDCADGLVSVHTDASPPRIGEGVSQAQGLAMDLLSTASKRRAAVVYDANRIPALALAREMLNPEGLGFAVTAEVRDRARDVLGMERVETVQRRRVATQ